MPCSVSPRISYATYPSITPVPSSCTTKKTGSAARQHVIVRLLPPASGRDTMPGAQPEHLPVDRGELARGPSAPVDETDAAVVFERRGERALHAHSTWPSCATSRRRSRNVRRCRPPTRASIDTGSPCATCVGVELCDHPAQDPAPAVSGCDRDPAHARHGQRPRPRGRSARTRSCDRCRRARRRRHAPRERSSSAADPSSTVPGGSGGIPKATRVDEREAVELVVGDGPVLDGHRRSLAGRARRARRIAQPPAGKASGGSSLPPPGRDRRFRARALRWRRTTRPGTEKRSVRRPRRRPPSSAESTAARGTEVREACEQQHDRQQEQPAAFAPRERHREHAAEHPHELEPGLETRERARPRAASGASRCTRLSKTSRPHAAPAAIENAAMHNDVRPD